MRAAIILLAVLAISAASHAADALVEQPGSSFRVREGLVVEPVAMPPLVQYPIVADLDQRGRLYVAESAGPIGNLANQQADPPHRIVRLEDEDGDGRYDKRIVFADKLMFPEGVLCIDENTILISAVPQILKLQDTDGDGRADRRDVWFDGGTLTGCGNDLHGPYRGPDGWIYWCKGAFAEQAPMLLDGSIRPNRAAHMYRRRLSGGPLDLVMTGGMDNPIEVAFNREGDRFFTSTFVQHPAGGKRDGIVHAIYGAIFGKDHDVIDGYPRTGPLFGPMTHLGPAAPSGLTTLQSELLIPGGRGWLACTQFNLQKVTLHQLQPAGATYQTNDQNLLVSSQIDFHPTDVLEDADGSLLVVDTGGWYDLCCPTSGLDQAKAYGGIYRVRRDERPIADPRGLKLAWDRVQEDDLIRRLGDPRPAVRRRAAQSLEALGNASVRALERLIMQGSADHSIDDRCDAVWILERIGDSQARIALRNLAGRFDEPAIAQAAMTALALQPESEDLGVAVAALDQIDQPRLQRVAAELISRAPMNQQLATSLLAAAGGLPLAVDSGLPDRATFHALTYALFNKSADGQEESVLREAISADRPPAMRAAAMIALDQRGAMDLPAALLVDAWLNGAPIERSSSEWILARRADVGEALAARWDDLLSRLIADAQSLSGQTSGAAAVLASHLTEPALSERLTDWLASVEATDPAITPLLEQAAAKAARGAMPDAWVQTIIGRLPSAESPLRESLFAILRNNRISETQQSLVSEQLDGVAARPDLPLTTRLAAIGCRPTSDRPLTPPALAALQDGLSAEPGSDLRRMALDGLQRVPITAELQPLMVELAKNASPVELPPLLQAARRGASAKLAAGVIGSLADNPAAWRMPQQAFDDLASITDPAVQSAMQALQQRAAHALAEQRTQLAKLLTELDQGDPVAGYQVFRSSKAACSACHAIGYVGGQVGPDLSKIGSIRRREELLEAIVLPSNNIVQSYDSVSVITVDGRVVTGLIKESRPDSILLVSGVDQQTRIPRDEIDSIQPSDVSIMPTGLEQVLSRRELSDLLAFLESAKDF